MNRSCGICLLSLALFIPSSILAESKAFDDSLFQSLEWREVGPYRGGRSAAVTGIPGRRDVYYFGATGGGVWKTDDGGKSWDPVSDGFFGGSIGAVAVSAWDPNVVYAGGGEKTVRGNVSHGDGVWKSTDAGKTWKHIGLADSRHIPRIRIHPRDPALVYAAVLGHLFGPNPERGVYRSRDGGDTWEQVLHVSDERRCRRPGDGSRPTHAFSTPRSGGYCARRGAWSRGARVRGCGNQPTAATLGTSCRISPGCRKAPSASSVSTSRPQTQRTSTPSSRPKRAGSTAPATAATPGRRPTTNASCASALGTTPVWSPTRRTRNPSTCSTCVSTARRTAARPSPKSTLPTATTTTCGSTPTIRCA